MINPQPMEFTGLLIDKNFYNKPIFPKSNWTRVSIPYTFWDTGQVDKSLSNFCTERYRVKLLSATKPILTIYFESSTDALMFKLRDIASTWSVDG